MIPIRYAIARVCEASTWARFGQALFFMGCAPGVPIPLTVRAALCIIGISAIFVSAAFPDPK